MKIKKEFLNENTLAPYGFVKSDIYGDGKYVEYIKKCPYCKIFTQRCTGELAISIKDCDCANIDDTVYQLIADGLVEV